MPSEIADSDAESEVNSPKKLPIEPGDSHLIPDALPMSSAIDFYQYMDTTQRLSSLPFSDSDNNNRATGSTEKIINQIDAVHDELNASLMHESRTMSPTSRPKKRAHSTFMETSASFEHMTPRSAKAKRSKTYGHRSKSDADRDALFTAPSQPSKTPALLSPPQLNADNATPTDQSVELRPYQNHANSSNFVGSSFHGSSSLQNMTSMASMGNYQSINLDYRSCSTGLDINANPFGSLSQNSLDENTDTAGNNPTAQISDPREHTLTTDVDHSARGQRGQAIDALSLPAFPQSSQDQLTAVVPPANEPGLSADNPNLDLATLTKGSENMPAPNTLPAANDEIQTKKRGRKPKVVRASPKPTSHTIAMDEIDELDLPDIESIRQTRQGTVDSISAASYTSSNTKRKRKQSKVTIDSNDIPGNRMESSPVKQPTSELQLSDEHVIGLPKESYKPRPSRSRSKRIADDDDGYNQGQGSQTSLNGQHVGQNEVPEKEADHSPQLESKQPPAKSSAKKGRKNKVKRAKTSAAALLKKTEPMLSEGEEDVVWMDSKPAPVKLELPPDLKILKKESDPDVKEGSQKEGKTIDNKVKTTEITIEIPTTVEEMVDPVQASTSTRSAPKKRGRKPKKAQQADKSSHLSEERVVEEVDDGDHNEQNLTEKDPQRNNSTSRSALSERSTNIPPAAPKNPDPKAPTISPLSSPEPKHQQPKSPTSKNDPPTKPQITPIKQIPNKGPTQHSPINPPIFLGGSNSNSSTGKTNKTIYRIGLSRRQNIPSLLSRVQRGKEPPKIVVRKEKENKKKGDNGSDDEAPDPTTMRGADGMLIEWAD